MEVSERNNRQIIIIIKKTILNDFFLFSDFHQLCKSLRYTFSDAVILEHSDDPHTEENITEKNLEELCLRAISSYISELVAFT